MIRWAVLAAVWLWLAVPAHADHIWPPLLPGLCGQDVSITPERADQAPGRCRPGEGVA